MKPRPSLWATGLAALGWLATSAAGDQHAPKTPGGPPVPPPPASHAPARDMVVAAVAEPAPPGEAFTLRFRNRPITVLRARLFGRTPEDRARARARNMEELAAAYPAGPVEWRLGDGFAVITIAGQEAFTLLPADVDPLAGTLDTAAREARDHLRLALAEASEARSPALLARAALRALGATALAALLAWLLWRARTRAMQACARSIEARVLRPLEHRARGDVWRTTEASLARLVRHLGRLLVLALAFLLAWGWLGFVLRQFPYTRPWGEAMRGFVIGVLLRLWEGLLAAVPGLFTVALIVLLTRLVTRVASALFLAAEQGRLTLPGVYPDTAQPTRRLTVALLWLFAVVVAYPYLPGSDSDAFKGVSVFVGLMVSLGSSGLVNQAMSSFMITYARALRVGDYVRIGEIEGSVVSSGLLATKLLTRRNEEITLPNAVVASSTITNYSRHSGEGVFVKTAVTIGYDTPWRQVEAMLLEAAARTSGVRSEPSPRVLQTGLQDFYVEYTLLVAPERPEERPRVLSELHGHIQDAFNEHGVQIMSPHYEADPAGPKIVPKSGWFAPPAGPKSGD